MGSDMVCMGAKASSWSRSIRSKQVALASFVVRRMWRASMLFLGLLAIVLGIGTLARNVLGFGCVGPELPAWGCLAVPYPSNLPSGFTLFYYLGVGGAAWLVCYTLRNPLFFLGNWALRRLFPQWMGELDQRQEPVRTYTIR